MSLMLRFEHALIESQAQQDVIEYFRVAPLALWVYDYLLTLGDEVHLMTSNEKWSITHLLFISARYFPAIVCASAIYSGQGLHSLPHPFSPCVTLYQVAETFMYVGMGAAEGLLLVRTLVLWHHSSHVKNFIVSIFVVVSLSMLICAIISIALRSKIVCAEVSPTNTPQDVAIWVQSTTALFYGSLAFEFVVLCFTILHGLRAARDPFSARLASALNQGNLVYAASMLVSSAANIVFFLLPLEVAWNGMLAPLQTVLHGVLASRILFALRAKVRASEDDIASLPIAPTSRMRFACASSPAESSSNVDAG
ncbi:hypothetical protein HYDPIDRAFT_27951 [Hydnomerulius pinastri MD-312]|uniref:DUF6533 domain-containing protein n=1 Tax=Hydnomerulius pinastri MD-312 TaxID=994086 RepID=A0A0C9WFX9_9AGAM|nr:hypothetical protein HYDPIDRAFT_27951 [Hydnomerulius pinastri MD-312]